MSRVLNSAEKHFTQNTAKEHVKVARLFVITESNLRAKRLKDKSCGPTRAAMEQLTAGIGSVSRLGSRCARGGTGTYTHAHAQACPPMHGGTGAHTRMCKHAHTGTHRATLSAGSSGIWQICHQHHFKRGVVRCLGLMGI